MSFGLVYFDFFDLFLDISIDWWGEVGFFCGLRGVRYVFGVFLFFVIYVLLEKILVFFFSFSFFGWM